MLKLAKAFVNVFNYIWQLSMNMLAAYTNTNTDTYTDTDTATDTQINKYAYGQETRFVSHTRACPGSQSTCCIAELSLKMAHTKRKINFVSLSV